MKTASNWTLLLNSIIVFRNVLKDPAVSALRDLTETRDPAQALSLYGNVMEELFHDTTDLGSHVFRIVAEDENIFVQKLGKGEAIDPILEKTVERELKILEQFAGISASAVKQTFGFDPDLAEWTNTQADFGGLYKERIRDISKYGYGVFAGAYAFYYRAGRIRPVMRPDPIRLDELVGYTDQRQTVLENTLALLDGKKAANILLYGDAGTGKSSTVKAIVNELHGKGLRLIEVPKKSLHDIPELMEKLAEYPVRFIVFIDDLSFQQDDDDFAVLKAILEGSVSARPDNVLVYATSNRRHLVKEYFSNREGDDVHISDTMEEIASLSDRFGLSVTFLKPDRERYLEIVHSLCRQAGIAKEASEIDLLAERYALRHSGRSPRIARQFVDMLTTKE